jgi:hypothetical protein
MYTFPQTVISSRGVVIRAQSHSKLICLGSNVVMAVGAGVVVLDHAGLQTAGVLKMVRSRGSYWRTRVIRTVEMVMLAAVSGPAIASFERRHQTNKLFRGGRRGERMSYTNVALLLILRRC